MAKKASAIHQEYFDRDNTRAAQVIIANPQRYTGLPLIWAQLFLSRHVAPAQPVKGGVR